MRASFLYELLMTDLQFKRRQYAWWLVEMSDTVIISTVEEVQSILDRADAGEFDNDLECVLHAT